MVHKITLINGDGTGPELAEEMKRAKRYNRALSLIYFDIDDFKKINDEYSHLTGDKVLIRISQILKNNIRKTDTLSRWGGEEFSVLCQDSNIDNTKNI